MDVVVSPPFRDVGLFAGGDVPRIATLGPAGTSSETAAHQLAAWLPAGDDAAQTQLYPTYEAAAVAVLAREADLLVVANAYANVAAFYMDTALRLVGAFIHRTPEYGIAVPRGRQLPARPRVATHPAPTPLIAQLMPAGSGAEVVIAASTSAAALAACAGEVDGALTTKVAAELYHLQFVSPTRPIDMLWSVFQATAARAGRGAAEESGQAPPDANATDRLGSLSA